MKTWITDASHGIPDMTGINGLDDFEQTDTGDVIDLTGWWEAENWQTELWSSAKGGGGDDNYYIKEWTDSSGHGNHLLDSTLGQGPMAYGSGTNEHGSSSDELNGHSVAHFTNVTSGNAQGQLFLQCTASVANDFIIQSFAPTRLFTFIAVCRHHYDSDDLSDDYLWIGHDMGIVAQGGIEWSLGFAEGEDENTTKASFHCNSGTGTNYLNIYNTAMGNGARDVENMWGTISIWSMDTSFDGGDTPPQGWLQTDRSSMSSFQVPSYNYTSETQSIGFNSGDLGTGVLTVGMNNFSTAPDDFEGRIVEMACFKSDQPISLYKRAQILQYFKNKFDL